MRCCLAVLLYLLLAGCVPGAGSPPNIVILVADDLGWNDLGAYGNEDVYTPHIDQLASGGLRFDNAFLTTSSCSASRASILTGTYPHSNGLVHLHQAMPGSVKTVAHYLKEAGYHTASAGKWHIGTPAKADFDRVVEDREERGEEVTDLWLQALRERPAEKPFFLWLASRDPHPPHDRGREFADRYPATLSLPRDFVAGPGVQRELLNYYLEVSSFDQGVGEVIAELEKQGVLDDTVVIVMSDNGRPFHRAKMTLYDDGIKTPLIISWPRSIPAAGHYDYLVSAIDIAPTLLELAGAAAPETMQGRSFLGVFQDRSVKLRDQVFAERNWHGRNAHERAVRTEQFLYKENQYPGHGDCVQSQVSHTRTFQALQAAHQRGELDEVAAACFAAQRDSVELLAVSSRGVEFANLAEDPAYADVRSAMQQALDEWRTATGDFDYRPYEPPVK